MSNIIQLLERMGQDANLQTRNNFEQVVEGSELSAELKQTLLNKDVTTLERQLDICPDVVCVMLPAEDEEPETKDEPVEDKTEIRAAG